MPTIMVTRTWEVTIPQKDLDAIKAKGLSDSDLYYTCTEYANSGEFGKLYCVRYKNEEAGLQSELCWGVYNDIMDTTNGETEILYELESWDAKEQAWNVS